MTYFDKEFGVLKAGQILLVHTAKGILPRLIRWFTKCHWNHAALLVDLHGTLYVQEATEKGFLPTTPIREYLLEVKKGERDILVFEDGRKPLWSLLPRINRLLQDIHGNKYELFNLGFYQVIKAVFKHWIGTRNAKRVICSEAVAYVYQHIFHEWHEATPEDIYWSKGLNPVLETKNGKLINGSARNL